MCGLRAARISRLNLHYLRKFRKTVVARLQFQERHTQPGGMVKRCSDLRTRTVRGPLSRDGGPAHSNAMTPSAG